MKKKLFLICIVTLITFVLSGCSIKCIFGHTEVVDEAKEPTCTETGLTEGKHCSVCGDVIVAQETIRATGHTEEIIAGKDATCTESGLTEGKKCSVCGEILTAQEEIAAKGHTESAWIVDKEANCTESGTRHKECTVCGVKLSEETIAAKGHTEVIDARVEPTCTGTGLTEGSHCSVCGLVFAEQETIEVLGHNAVIDVRVEPTCTETGLTEGSHCSNCGEVYIAQEIIEALGHTEAFDEGFDSTCSETGLTDGSHCSVCGEVIIAQTVIEKKPHTNSEWIVDTEPTCTKEGSRHIECTVCGETKETEIIPATGIHTIVIDEAKPATCLESGLTEGCHCSVCGQTIVAQEVIEKTTHTYSDWIIDVQPTCILSGNRHRECTVCHSILESEMMVSTGIHTPVTDPAKAATCMSTGLTEGSHCSVCGQTIVAQRTIEKTDHVIVKDAARTATCTLEGLTEGSHCSLCGQIFQPQFVIPKIDHKMSNWITDKAATCAANGSEHIECTACHTVLETRAISATGMHTIVTEPGKAATCTTDGLTDGSHCSVCGKVIIAQLVLPKSHTWVWDAPVSPTCTKSGLTEGSHCSVCGTIITKQETIPALGHIGAKDWIIDAHSTKTCTGKKHQVCTRCNENINITETPIIDGTEGLGYSVNEDGNTCRIIAGGIGTCSDRFIVVPHYIDGFKVTEIESSAFNSTSVLSVYIPNTIERLDGPYSIFLAQYRSAPVKIFYEGSYDDLFNKGLSSGNFRAEGWEGDMDRYRVDSLFVYNDIGVSDKYLYTPDFIFEIKDDGTLELTSCSYSSYGKKEMVIPSAINGRIVTSIGNCAFYNCPNLTSITIPDGVTSIGNYAFYSCPNITSITIPDSVTRIGNYAFNNCPNLMNISIFGNLSSIGYSAFQNTPFYNNYDYANYSDEDGCLYSGKALLRTYNLTKKHYSIKQGTITISDYAFYGRRNLTSITIPDSVTSIGNSAFGHCTGLTSITIPDSLTSIGNYAFYYCTGLTSITIPDSVTSIDDGAFYCCRGLTSITYTGTKSQWNSISKVYGWDDATPTYTIHCTDGDITKQ